MTTMQSPGTFKGSRFTRIPAPSIPPTQPCMSTFNSAMFGAPISPHRSSGECLSVGHFYLVFKLALQVGSTSSVWLVERGWPWCYLREDLGTSCRCEGLVGTGGLAMGEDVANVLLSWATRPPNAGLSSSWLTTTREIERERIVKIYVKSMSLNRV